MNAADVKRAAALSKQLGSLGYRPKIKEPQKKRDNLDWLSKRTGLDIPKMRVEKPKAKPTPFKFNYDALRIKNGEDGKDGRTATTEELLALMRPLIQHAMAEMSKPLPELTDEFVKSIVQKMHALPEADKLEVSKGIRNAQSFIFNKTKYDISEMMHGAGASSSNISFVDNEIVAGSGTSWILSSTPVVGSVQLHGNGQFLIAGGIDYTIVGTAITTVNPFASGTLVANYRT